jgi:hypothetical protein
VDRHVAGLPDTERPVRGLVLDGGVPPAVEVDDVERGGRVQAGAAGLQRQDEEGHGLVLPEPADQAGALPDPGPAVLHQARPAEHRAQERGERGRGLPGLREDLHLHLA